VLEAARRVTGHPIPVVIGPRRPGDPACLVAAVGRAQQELGWQPTHTAIDLMVASSWRWHVGHPHGYRGR
jgi:UDP-glucose 4-epimerase